jgi:cytochrome P450 / NADPH-cytochrome P450 reductase
MKNAAAYRNAQEEVDRVIGTGSLALHHMKDLKYLTAVLREAIRLFPPAPGISLKAKDGEATHYTLGDHVVEGNPPILVLMEKVHRDPEVYGEDADEFRPERMLDEKFNKLPKNAWKVSCNR